MMVASTIWADKTAYRTARYGGWSKEHSCERNTNGERCWTLTVGKNTWNHEVADLSYTWRADGEEWLSFSFWATIVVKTDDPVLTVRWDLGHEEPLATWVDTGENRGKPMYWFSIADPQGFFVKAENHDRLTVTLPYRDDQGRFVRGKFSMRNMRRSIASAMQECGIHQGMLGRLTG